MSRELDRLASYSTPSIDPLGIRLRIYLSERTDNEFLHKFKLADYGSQ